MAEEYDYLFKSIVVGDGGVGKTALTLRFSKGFFTEDYKMTIGVDFHVKTITIDTDEGPIRAKLQIWDTGGQERFSSIRPMYYRGSLGALLIFDLTNSASFEHLPGWIEEIRVNVKTEIPLLLVGNKSDLFDQRAISLEEINKFTNNFNLYYMETSAKTGEGVGDCFYILACLMIGSGVPDQLISSGVVYQPGHVPITTSATSIPSIPQIKSEFDYSAPPVPEPMIDEKQHSSSKFEPEPEFDYSAPPVPEPISVKSSESKSTFESEFEPEIPIPEPIMEMEKTPTDFEFKTPEEILAEEKLREQTTSRITSFQAATSGETYKPRAAPFTSNVPVPAPAPKEFQSNQNLTSIEKSSEKTTPFLVAQDTNKSKSQSLVDYMPEPILSKKEKKKIEKQKKKEEKEKRIQAEKEKQQKLIDDMKKAKKEKKEKPKKDKKENLNHVESQPSVSERIPTAQTETSEQSTLFQALTQKSEEASTSPFVPFSAGEELKIQEPSKLRIIPNVTNLESQASGFTPIQSAPATQKTQQKPSKKEIIVCKQCGAILSADYAFCNKCGNKL
ncbi:MAG: GTP-binding protein [Promethearchaeota archaeon]